MLKGVFGTGSGGGGGATIANTTNLLIGDGAGNAVAAGAGNITATSANALTVGQNGATNPGFKVDTSTASSVSGVTIKSAATGTAVTQTASGPDTNIDYTISAKGFSAMRINNLGGFVQFQNNAQVIDGQSTVKWSGADVSGGNKVPYTFQGNADANLATGSETTSYLFNFSQTRTHATGALALQRDIRIQTPTHAFAAASVLSAVYGLSIDGAPIAGTNATLTETAALNLGGQAVNGGGAVTNSYGLITNPNTGATNNYGAKLNGITTLTGGFGLPIRVVTAAGGIATTIQDATIVVNKTTGAATAVSLTTPSYTQVITIKDGKGDAATNNITITPASGTIDGVASKTLNTAFGAFKVQFDGTNWWVV